jgi:hypothetical protein
MVASRIVHILACFVILTTAGNALAQGAATTAMPVLHGNASGAPGYSAVDLATDVTGVLPPAVGGTGVDGSAAGDGYLLIGNGHGFDLDTLAQGHGAVISRGSGTVTIALTMGVDSTGVVTDPTLTGDGVNTTLALNRDNALVWNTSVAVAPNSYNNVTALVVKQTAASPTTADVLAVSTSGGAKEIVVDNSFNLMVRNNVQIGDVTGPVDGHLLSRGSTIVPGAVSRGGGAAAAGPPTSAHANDIAGFIYFERPVGGGGGMTAGDVIQIPFTNTANTGFPVVVITSAGPKEVALAPYAYYSNTLPGIIIGISSAPANGAAPQNSPANQYWFGYHVIWVQ